MPRSIKKEYLKELNRIKKIKQKYRSVFSLIRKYKSTKSADFITHYYKNTKTNSNKLAYLAGLIDGEGYLKVEKWGTIRLIIGMCDKTTIYWIKNNFGGNVSKEKTAKGRTFYVWRLNQGKDLFYLLLLVIPFMITKKKKLVSAMLKLIKKFEKLEHTLSYIERGD